MEGCQSEFDGKGSVSVNVGSFVALLRRHLGWTTVFALLGVLVGGFYARAQPASYSSTSRIAIVAGAGVGPNAQQVSGYIQSQMQTYAEAATTSTVLQPVIDKLNLATDVAGLQGRVSVRVPIASSVLDISSTAQTASEAAALADAVAESMSRSVARLSTGGTDGKSLVGVVLLQDGGDSVVTHRPNLALFAMYGLLVGLLLSAAVSWLLDSGGRVTRRRTTRRSRRESG